MPSGCRSDGMGGSGLRGNGRKLGSRVPDPFQFLFEWNPVRAISGPLDALLLRQTGFDDGFVALQGRSEQRS